MGGLAIPMGLGLTGSITAILLGNFLGCVATGICAGMGPRYGMPQLVMGRSSFGYIGNYVPAICSTILYIGYATVGTIVGAKAMSNLLGVPFIPVAVIVGVISILLAVYGYTLLHITSRWITLLGLAVLVVSTVIALVHGVGHAAIPSISGVKYWIVWLTEFTVVFSFTISWMLYASDYSRYLPSNASMGKIFWYAFSGLFIGTCWMMILGAMLVSIKPAGVLQGFDAILPTWLLWVVLISLTLTSVTHNSVQLYSCSMSCLTWDLPVKRVISAVLAGICAVGIAAIAGRSQFINNFGQFLTIMSYFMLPWLAIRLVQFYKEGRKNMVIPTVDFYSNNGRFAGIKWSGLGSFVIGILVSVPFMANDFYTGPVAKSLGGADVSYFVAFIVALILFVPASLMARRNN